MPAKKKRTTAKKTATRAKKTIAHKSRSTKATSAKRKSASPAKKKVAKTAIRAAYKKTQLLTHIAETTGVSKKEVTAVFEELGNVMHRHLRKGGAGEFTIPGLIKCVVKRKPATKARRGANPFTGEMITFKAKPARNVVKVRTLKKLKEMVE